MFGIMEVTLSFLRRQIGLRTDAADAVGSVHAKIGDLKNNVFPWHKKTATFSRGVISYVNNNQTINALEITGDRVILSSEIRVKLSIASQVYIKLIIDGVEILPFNTSLANFTNTEYGYSVPYNDGTNTYCVMSLSNLHFSTSFVVQVWDNGTGGGAHPVAVSAWHVPA